MSKAETVTLEAADGHRLAAYLSRPQGTPRAGLVVVQEVFGVNSHIRSVADGFAAEGYLAVAPALFDRIEPGLEIVVAEALRRELLRRGGARLVEEPDDADIVISGRVSALRSGRRS